jgi:hypothetical protein
MAYYEITVPNPHYTNYDAEKRYGIQFNNGVAHVPEDQLWVTTGANGPTSTVSTPVWQLFEAEYGYTVRRLEPGEAPIVEPEVKVTSPHKARD